MMQDPSCIQKWYTAPVFVSTVTRVQLNVCPDMPATKLHFVLISGQQPGTLQMFMNYTAQGLMGVVVHKHLESPGG